MALKMVRRPIRLSLRVADHIVAAASIEEFMTMVAGGLAGASPHMISATVTAISRLVFEFKGVVSRTYLSPILILHRFNFDKYAQ